ncbi:MAG: M14 family zinc carboxypeptidase, partial [Calditrichota bacterium]
GTAAFSEPETQAIRDFCIAHQFGAALNYHTFSNLLIYPYGYDVNVFTPDSALFDQYGTDMTQFNNYAAGTAISTVGYTANGNSDDWMYGEQATKGKIMAMTPEVGGFSDGFWPQQSRIFPLVEENLYPNLYLAWIVGGLVSSSSENITEVGDGNGYVDPGESAEVTFTLKNIGLGDAANVTVDLTTVDPNITISGNGGGPYNIASQAEQQTEIFNVQVDAAASAGSEVFVDLTIFIDGNERQERRRLFIVGTPDIALSNDAESGTTGWTTGQGWNTVTNTFVSPISSFADSPSGNYQGNANNNFAYIDPIDLTSANSAFLEFMARWEIESNYDYARVQVSTNGSSWTSLVGTYTREGSGQGVQTPGEPGYDGNQLSWVKEVMDLSGYLGNTILIRFNLSSDGFVEGDGWYLDDIAVTTYTDPVTGIEPQAGVPNRIELNANYPNPFNPSTTISFGIPEAGQVRLTIYNVLGQPIRELVNSEFTAGNYQLSWDGRDSAGNQVSSGLYFYRLDSENQKLVRRMMLSK